MSGTKVKDQLLKTNDGLSTPIPQVITRVLGGLCWKPEEENRYIFLILLHQHKHTEQSCLCDPPLTPGT